ncbi:hypothetical protein D3C85_1378090 [compost metagenome]
MVTGSSMATSIAIRQKFTGLLTSCSKPAASVPMAAIFSCWSIWPLISTSLRLMTSSSVFLSATSAFRRNSMKRARSLKNVYTPLAAAANSRNSELTMKVPIGSTPPECSRQAAA